jgi:hypothetical protein
MPIDHFWNKTDETYMNRYWVNDTWYEPGGPVFGSWVHFPLRVLMPDDALSIRCWRGQRREFPLCSRGKSDLSIPRPRSDCHCDIGKQSTTQRHAAREELSWRWNSLGTPILRQIPPIRLGRSFHTIHLVPADGLLRKSTSPGAGHQNNGRTSPPSKRCRTSLSSLTILAFLPKT